MRNGGQRIRLLSRRTALLAAGKAVVLSVLAGRMYQLQVLESERLRTLAKENRIDIHLLAPPRGLILDRFGRPIATSRDLYRVSLAPYRQRDVTATLDRLAELIPIDDDVRRRVAREVAQHRGFSTVTVHESVNWRDVARVEVNAPDLSGVSVAVDERRLYPYAEKAAHLVGYVSKISRREIRDNPLLRLPRFRTGKRGIEGIHEHTLRGEAGTSEVEVNAQGRVIRELSRREPRAGRDVRLALDLPLQLRAVERLAEQRSAAAVVLDVETGEVLVQASVPSYDPNRFVGGLSGRDWRSLRDDPLRPLVDRTIAGLYAPGSTFKIVVALAALEAGIGAGHRVRCRGHVNMGSHRFHCWKKWGHGTKDLAGAFAESCDVYFYNVARRLGPDRIAAMARRLGLGVATGIGLPGEKAGTVPSRAWKKARMGESWYPGETLIYGIGQGYVLTTPLQLAVMTARVANVHKAVTPRLLRAPEDGAWDPGFANLDVSRSALSIVRKAMFGVCNTRKGTAYQARIEDKGMEMAGKTGTSQVRRISKSERRTRVLKNEERPWRERDHSLFVGYAPAERPRFAAAVVVEHGGSGSKVAAPIAGDILREAQRRLAEPARPPLIGTRQNI